MYDIIIKNGMIVDGTRKKPYAGSVGIKDGKIVKVTAGDMAAEEAKTVIDAAGHIVAPGFVDVHTHSDKSYLACPTHESKLRSGITFELCGQCGLSCIPVSEKNITSQASLGGLLVGESDRYTYKPRDMKTYAEDYNSRPQSINVGMSIGHGALRSTIVGWDQRPLTPQEMDEMCALLDKELKAGALGVSFGLIYPPGSFCDTEEIKALARVCAANNKFLSVHMRNENRRVFEALDEMIEVAKETGVRLEISHLKLMGKTMWGRSGELLAKIDQARAKGISIHADQYPYAASHSKLTSSFPKEAMDGGYGALAEHLKDDEWWDRISDHGTLPEMEFRGGAANIAVADLANGIEWPEVMGKTLTELAEMWACDVPAAIRKLLLGCRGVVDCIYHNMSEEDVLNIMSQRDISVVSDGTAYDLHNYNGRPHPRNAGHSTRFLRLVREHDLMPIEDAVYKLTGLPAAVMGMEERFGFLKEGLDANVTIFDKDTVTDHATYEEPAQASEGIDYVIVNGEVVLDHDVITDARPGKCILG